MGLTRMSYSSLANATGLLSGCCNRSRKAKTLRWRSARAMGKLRGLLDVRRHQDHAIRVLADECVHRNGSVSPVPAASPMRP